MRLLRRIVAVSLVFLLIVSSGVLRIEAAVKDTLEIGEVSSLGKTVEVPVILHGTSYLTSANLTVILPADLEGVTVKGFQPTGIFTGSHFRTISNVTDDSVTIDVISNDSKEIRLDARTVVGHIIYQVSPAVASGDSIQLKTEKVSAIGRNGAPLTFSLLDGKISRAMPKGDVVGKNKPNAAAAIRILQHAKGNPITDSEALKSADVNGDQQVTQVDAQMILDYIAGKRYSFVALETAELQNAAVKSEYQESFRAVSGRAPYSYRRVGGSLPSGLTLNSATGLITGKPTREGVYNFDIEVTDAVDETARASYTINVLDTNISSVESLPIVNVKKGMKPDLPDRIKVTYKDRTTDWENVSWQPVDTSKLGSVFAKGMTESGFGVTVEVHVVEESYFLSFDSLYSPLMNLHVINLQAADSVSAAYLDGKELHYEGEGEFTLGTNTFTQGTTATLTLEDKYGTLLETKQVILN